MKKLSMLLAALALFLLGMANLDETEDYPWRNHEEPFNFRFANMIDNHQQSRVLPEDNKLQGFLYIHYTGAMTEEGYPIAERADCDSNPDECRVGWVLKGIPIEAELVQKGPRLWLVDPNSLPQEPGYGHFQWVDQPGSPHDLVVGDVKQGFLLKRIAPAPFYWLGGQGGSGGGGGGGHDGGDCGDEGGCDGHDGSDCGDEGGCDGHDGSDGGCDGHDGSDGGCDGHDGSDGGCDGHDGGSGGPGGSGGHNGRLVPEGVDHHSNIVTDPDDVGHGGGGGCDGHNGGA